MRELLLVVDSLRPLNEGVRTNHRWPEGEPRRLEVAADALHLLHDLVLGGAEGLHLHRRPCVHTNAAHGHCGGEKG